MGLRLMYWLLVFFISVPVLAEDPILQWINSVAQEKKNDTTAVWNPGLLPFDETQLRLKMSDDSQGHLVPEQSLRLGIKPLAGLGNEIKLSQQLQKVSTLESQGLRQSSRLQAYQLVLYYWQLRQSLEVLKNSESLFVKAKSSLNVIQKQKHINFNIAKYLKDVSSFFKTQSYLREQIKNVEKSIAESLRGAVLQKVDSITFLPIDKVAEFLVKNNFQSSALQIEEEKRKLKYFEFQKEKSESRQLLKFVDVSRESRFNRADDYRFQVAIRVPFMSDNLELEKAKLDYIKEDHQFEQSKVKVGRDLDELKSQVLGLIAEVKILQRLPKKSYNNRLMKSSLSSMSVAVSNEMEFVEAKLSLIQSKSQILDKFLQFLGVNHLLTSRKINYLTELPKP